MVSEGYTYIDTLELSAERLYQRYLKAGDEFLVLPNDGIMEDEVMIKDLSDEFIIIKIKEMEYRINVLLDDHVYILTWYNIYNDVFLKRRLNKLLKIKNNIDERKNTY